MLLLDSVRSELTTHPDVPMTTSIGIMIEKARRTSYREHPCIDCGQPCDKRGLRCHKCWGLTQRKSPDEVIAKRKVYQQRYEASVRKRHTCPDCGKPCDRRAKRCMDCHNKFIAHPQQWSNLPKGQHPANWKGGKQITPHGYVLIYSPNHPRANCRHYVFEHILVWEQHHGRLLPKGWIIHHLNGMKHDNRIENLVALPNHKHLHVLAAKAKRIQELEALLHNQGQLC